MGIIAAIGALVCWATGDFLIQKASRKIGDWGTVLFIGIAGFILLTPFVLKDILTNFRNVEFIILLFILGIVGLVSTLCLFEALKRGKLSIIEPVLSFELPVTVLLAAFFWNEIFGFETYIVIGVIFLGLLLTVVVHHSQLHLHKIIFERGVLLALISAVTMGAFNFLAGVSSQTISPLFTIWFVHTFMGIATYLYIAAKGNLRAVFDGYKKNSVLVTLDSVLDNAAWILYAISASLIPISIATSISESYVALAVGFGILINKDKIKKHQFIGVGVVLLGIIILTIYY